MRYRVAHRRAATQSGLTQVLAPMSIKKKQFALALLTVCSIASAQAPSSTTAREITSLFTSLEASGCEFNRNGSWYTAPKASEHLRRKYDYLTKKHLVDSAESFIARAATESSMSGKAYQVRCPGKATIDSKVWFQAQLLQYRKAHVR